MCPIDFIIEKFARAMAAGLNGFIYVLTIRWRICASLLNQCKQFGILNSHEEVGWVHPARVNAANFGIVYAVDPLLRPGAYARAGLKESTCRDVYTWTISTSWLIINIVSLHSLKKIKSCCLHLVPLKLVQAQLHY
jgi:hypothetical protein